MVAGKSQEWLPPGFTEQVKVSHGRKVKVYTELSTGSKFYSKPSVSRYLESLGDIGDASGQNEPVIMSESKSELLSTAVEATIHENLMKENSSEMPEKMSESMPELSLKANDASIHEKERTESSSKMVTIERKPADGLPPGWIKEIKTTQSGNKIRKDPLYTELSTGNKFYSKPSVIRYLESLGNIGDAKGQNEHVIMSESKPELSSKTDEASTHEKEMKENSSEIPEKTSGSKLELSPVNEASIHEKKRKKSSSKMVTVERKPADGLPPGWTKEIKTTQSGNKTRKDTIYTELSSGNKFFSKPSVNRYLESLGNIGDASGQNEPVIMSESMPELSSKTDEASIREKEMKENSSEIPEKMSGSTLELSLMVNEASIHEKKRKKSSSKMVTVEGKPADGLPPGWIKEVKTTQSGYKTRNDTVYTELSTGNKFFSKPSVTRYLESLGNISDTSVRNELVIMSESKPELSSKTDEASVHDKEMKENSSTTPEKMSGSTLDLSPRANEASIHIKERKITIERKSADGLPPGWIKEIKTTQTGNKIRKDPFYVDPVSGYMFRSFQDVLRYLNTNDIRKCACKPIRRNSSDVNLCEDEIPAGIQSTPVNEKLPGPVEIDGESSIPKELAAFPETTNLEKNSYGSLEKIPEMMNNSEIAKEDAKSDVGFMADGTKQILQENGMQIKTSGAKSETRKTKKRKVPSVPLRSSKRLRGGEPEMPSGSDLNERVLRSAVKKSSGLETDSSLIPAEASAVPPSYVEPAKDAPFVIEENACGDKVDTCLNVLPPSIIKPAKEGTLLVSTQENAPPDEITKNHLENEAIPVEQNGGEPGEKPLHDGTQPEPGLDYLFGDSWPDPCLEFAFKTLTGEIPFDYPSTFNSYLGNQPEDPLFNPMDGFLGSSSEITEPKIGQNDIPTQPGPSKLHGNGAVDPAQSNQSPFAPMGDINFPTCSGFSSQKSGPEVNKKDYQTKVRS